MARPTPNGGGSADRESPSSPSEGADDGGDTQDSAGSSSRSRLRRGIGGSPVEGADSDDSGGGDDAPESVEEFEQEVRRRDRRPSNGRSSETRGSAGSDSDRPESVEEFEQEVRRRDRRPSNGRSSETRGSAGSDSDRPESVDEFEQEVRRRQQVNTDRGGAGNGGQRPTVRRIDTVDEFEQEVRRRSNTIGGDQGQPTDQSATRRPMADPVPAKGIESGDDELAQWAREQEEVLVEEYENIQSPDDIRIVEGDDEYQVKYTSSYFDRREREIAEKVAAENTLLEAEDVTVERNVTDGEVTYSTDVSEEGARAVDQRQQQALEGLGAFEPTPESDVRDRRVRQSLEGLGAGESVPQASDRRSDIDPEAVEEFKEGADAAFAGQEREGADPQAARAFIEGAEQPFAGQRRVVRDEPDEQFGDFDWSFGLGGEEDEVERALESASSRYRDLTSRVSEAGSFIAPASAPELVERVQEAARRADDPEELRDYILEDSPQETDAQRTAEGVAQGTLILGDVPGVTKGLLEGVEYVGFGGQEIAAGRGTEFAKDTGDAVVSLGLQGVSSFNENPEKSLGMAVGSLVGSYGAISTASRVSGRAGRATAAAIQPGEEILTYGINRVPVASRFGSRLPGGRLDNEELLLYAGQRAAAKVRQTPDVVRELRDELGTFAAANRGQADLAGRSKGRTRPRNTDLDDALDEMEETQRRIREAYGTEVDKPRPRVRQSGPRGPPGRRRYRRDDPATDPSTVDPEVFRRLRGELETETGAMTFGRLEIAVLLEEAQRSGFRPAEGQRVGLSSDIGRQLDERVDVGLETGVETRQRIETGLEVEQRTRVDTETELEQEFAQETELESEWEQELESEYEFEQESESEPFLPKQRRRDNRWFGGDTAASDKVFSSGIADVSREDFEKLFD